MEFSLAAHLHGVELKWVLRARWVHGLEVSLNRSASLCTWNTLIEQDDEHEWFVLFDFASTGEVRFKCSELEIVEYTAESKEATAE